VTGTAVSNAQSAPHPLVWKLLLVAGNAGNVDGRGRVSSETRGKTHTTRDLPDDDSVSKCWCGSTPRRSGAGLGRGRTRAACSVQLAAAFHGMAERKLHCLARAYLSKRSGALLEELRGHLCHDEHLWVDSGETRRAYGGRGITSAESAVCVSARRHCVPSPPRVNRKGVANPSLRALALPPRRYKETRMHTGQGSFPDGQATSRAQ
jgi:hypothetical protein